MKAAAVDRNDYRGGSNCVRQSNEEAMRSLNTRFKCHAVDEIGGHGHIFGAQGKALNLDAEEKVALGIEKCRMSSLYQKSSCGAVGLLALPALA